MHDTKQRWRWPHRLAGGGLGLLLGGFNVAGAAPTEYEVLHHFVPHPQVSDRVGEDSLPPTLGRDGRLYGLKTYFLGYYDSNGRSYRNFACVLYRYNPANRHYEELDQVDGSGGGVPVSASMGRGSVCSAPVEDAQGDWYWNTYYGGAEGAGQLLRFRPGVGIEVVFTFSAAPYSTEGGFPQSVLVQGPDGAFYGTTAQGGTHGNGTVFAYTPGQGVRVLHAFQRDPAYDTGEIRPNGPLVLSEDGSQLFGIIRNLPAQQVLDSAGNSLFALARDTGALTRLAQGPVRSNITNLFRPPGSDDLIFTYLEVRQEETGEFVPTFNRYLAAERRMVETDAVLPINDPGGGASPMGLTLGADNHLYGVFQVGGPNPMLGHANGTGSIFRLKQDGKYEVIHMLAGVSNGKLPEGAAPSGGVTLGPDGRLYGVTDKGGDFGQGVLFAVTPGDAIAPSLTFRLLASGEAGSTVLNKPDPHTIVAGQWAKFRWASVQADDCEGGGDWPTPGPIPVSGELEVTPAEPGEYRYVVSCRNTVDPTQRFTEVQTLTVLPTTGEHIEAGNGGAGALPLPMLLLAMLGLLRRRPGRALPASPQPRTY